MSKSKIKIGFMCNEAWASEVDLTDVTVYPTLEMLEEEHGEHCGVVEIAMHQRRHVKGERGGKTMTPAQLDKALLHAARKQLRQLGAYVKKLERGR